MLSILLIDKYQENFKYELHFVVAFRDADWTGGPNSSRFTNSWAYYFFCASVLSLGEPKIKVTHYIILFY